MHLIRAAWAAASLRPATACFALVCAVAIALEAWLLFAPRSFEFSGSKPVLVDALGSGAVVSQPFVAPADGLESVTVFLDAAAAAPGDRIWFRLLKETPRGYYAVASAVVAPEERRSALAFMVPTEVGSRGQPYKLEVKAVQAPSSLRLHAYSDGSIQPGTMSVGGTEQWGDLRLRLGAASRYRTFLAAARRQGGWKAQPALHLLVLALLNWAAAAFCFYLVVSPAGARVSQVPGRAEDPAA